MAQTTGAITFRNVKIEASQNGSTWSDWSGFSNKIEVGGGDREIGEFFTADGDTPILGAGKRAHIELTAAVVFTEGAADPAEILRQCYEAASPLYLRWSPKGGVSGQFQYTTGSGFVSGPVYPAGEVQSGDPVPIEFALHVQQIIKAVVA